MKSLFKIIVVLSIVFILIIPLTVTLSEAERGKIPGIVAEKEIFDWQTYYDSTIIFIKNHEGFNGGVKYIDAAGHLTIGYGHVVKADETFPDTITEREADKLLRKDFNQAVKAVERLTDLKANKKLAMAHFIYSKGVGNFARSTMRKLIMENKPIDDEIKKWCIFTNRRGRKIRSSYSLKTRLWELKLYNKEFKYIITNSNKE